MFNLFTAEYFVIIYSKNQKYLRGSSHTTNLVLWSPYKHNIHRQKLFKDDLSKRGTKEMNIQIKLDQRWVVA